MGCGGEEKVKGSARMREREFEGEDSVHEAEDAPLSLHLPTH